jgi:hypothetical protein
VEIFCGQYVQKTLASICKGNFQRQGKNAIRYLASYSFRTAIANSRIVSVDGRYGTFRYKCYADGSREKELRVDAEASIGPFPDGGLPFSSIIMDDLFEKPD